MCIYIYICIWYCIFIIIIIIIIITTSIAIIGNLPARARRDPSLSLRPFEYAAPATIYY